MARVEYEAFRREPFEEYDITMDMAPKLKAGISIASIEFGYPKATRISDGVDVTSTCIGTSSFTGAVITVRVKGGSDGQRIKIEFRITDTAGEKHETGLIMEIREV